MTKLGTLLRVEPLKRRERFLGLPAKNSWQAHTAGRKQSCSTLRGLALCHLVSESNIVGKEHV